MGHIVPRAEIEPTYLALQATVLPLNHVGSLMSPCLPVCSSLPQRSVQTNTRRGFISKAKVYQCHIEKGIIIDIMNVAALTERKTDFAIGMMTASAQPAKLSLHFWPGWH